MFPFKIKSYTAYGGSKKNDDNSKENDSNELRQLGHGKKKIEFFGILDRLTRLLGDNKKKIEFFGIVDRLTRLLGHGKKNSAFWAAWGWILAGDFDTSYAWKLGLHIMVCFFVVGQVIASLTYLHFKTRLYIQNASEVMSAPWLLLLFFVEVVYIGSSWISAVDNMLPPSRRPKLQLDCKLYPTVHILLPCCKEPTDLLVESIHAALKMDYPADRFKVLVLDDGGDNDLKVVCEALQVDTGGQAVYLRRTKVPGVPHNFKCGNLNYGLQHSNSEYVVMMDADMILHPSFLRTLLPHIVNSPDVAFVQIPQTFYNLPTGDPLNDSCAMGYQRVLPHRDSFGCATCIGTGCVFRREHIDAIGGFQPQSVTEDTTTAYALFNRGYKSVYLDEHLQIGLTPWTLEGYIKQRVRWGQGAIQQFRAMWRQMLGRDSRLHFLQKMLFFWHTGYYFLSFNNILLAGFVVCALLFNLKVSIGTQEASRQLFVHLCQYLIMWRISWIAVWLGIPQSVQSRNRDESHFWWMTPVFAKMIVQSLFSFESTFKFVPTSNIDRSVAKSDRSELAKQLGQLKQVRAHIVYVVVVLVLVIGKVGGAVARYGVDDCRDTFSVFGLSFFLLTTCAHMMLPVMYVLWPTRFGPAERKALLRYDADGVPVFDPQTCAERRTHWSVLFYEMISISTLAFWVAVLWIVRSGGEAQWCRETIM